MPLLKKLASNQLFPTYKYCAPNGAQLRAGSADAPVRITFAARTMTLIKSFRASRSVRVGMPALRRQDVGAPYVSFFLNASFKPDWAWS